MEMREEILRWLDAIGACGSSLKSKSFIKKGDAFVDEKVHTPLKAQGDSYETVDGKRGNESARRIGAGRMDDRRTVPISHRQSD
jgi:hypothetical protein